MYLIECNLYFLVVLLLNRCYIGKPCEQSKICLRVANSTVEYSAFNRLVPSSNLGRPIVVVVQ